MSCQAVFANSGLIGADDGGHIAPMNRKRRTTRTPMPTLRAWRERLGLSRAQVATMIDAARPERAPTDQATIAKWESGETEVRVTDMYLLAQIYGTTADRLLFDPGDLITPELMRRAHAVLVSKDREALAAWLASGEFLPDAQKSD